MKITKLFESQEKTFSFEFFPPKNEISAVDFGINVGQLIKLSPSFMTVTYGAGGSSQEKTFALVDYLQNKIGITCMAHYTCVNASKDKVKHDLQLLYDNGIENYMLLRGDPPKGQGMFIPTPDGFNYASELISFTKQNFDVCVGGGAYPEKHPEALSPDEDIKHLKTKVEAGAEFLVTQLFFINQHYFTFIEQARKIGIHTRIIPGIIPITSYGQINRFADMTGSKIPDDLREKMNSNKDNRKKIYQIGVDFAIDQCRELLANGAPGIHFYTLNKSRATVEIFEELKEDNLVV
jgi:methylenetetrahydrofolate reductase (NADPH)